VDIDRSRVLEYNERVNVQRPNRVTLTMPRKLVQTARAEAIKRGTTLSAVVRQLIKMWLTDEVELPTSKEKSKDQD
jgi:hypothetical protein